MGQAILDNWDQFVAENPVMIDDLRPVIDCAPDTDEVRKVVESFLGPREPTGG